MSRSGRIIALVAACLLLAVPFALTQSSVVDTRHNLSSTAGIDQITDISTDEDQICVFCHTPHKAAPAAPLWNHTQSAQGSYGVYTSPTFDGSTTIADIGGSGDVSNLCMSCHDGTVAVNSLGNPANDTGGNPAMGSGNELAASGALAVTNNANMGTSLTDDHPVNFDYASGDTGLAVPADPLNYVDAAQLVPLFDGKVQCASCHDPHNGTNKPFLTKTNSGSQLCLTCHVK